MGGKTALVAGASGITGRHLVLQMERAGGWENVYGTSRKPLDFGKQVQHISVDLTSGDDVASKLKDVGPSITHIFFCAYAMQDSNRKEAEVNLAMFKNVVERAEAAGAQLQHVHFVSGTKWYHHTISLSGIKTPSREDEPLAPGAMFYVSMEQYCIDRRKAGATWTWGSVRPNPVCGFSTGSYMNLSVSLAVYAAVCKERGLPFRFPGSSAAYNALLEVCDADLLAQAMCWIATTPGAQDASYNVSNGDIFRWSEVWPKLAEYFQLPTAEPLHFSMTSVMADEEDTWKRVSEKHGLHGFAYSDLATWGFADWVFRQEKDWFSSVNKLRRAGFQGMHLDNAEMFIRQFEEFQAAKVVP